MKIFKNRYSLYKEISKINNLSFVPTMGGFHKGHKYLIKTALKKTGRCIVSIYVNPKQFNSNQDFKTYPRNLKKDLKILKKLKVDYVYLPNNKDIFGFKTSKKIFLHAFNKKLCGHYRKKHFPGVINVVNRFLDIIKPKFIFLGKKDFQQLFLISKHINKRKINTKVIACKSIREKNGVTCSSRNENLSTNELKIASSVYHYIKKLKIKTKKNRSFKVNNKKIMNDFINLGVKKIDYIEILNTNNLSSPKFYKDKYNIFIAYYVGKTRLIDNI